MIEQQHTLPRDPTKYRHTIHSKQRFKDHQRLIHNGILREAIEDGEIETDDRDPNLLKFVLEWCQLVYTVVVSKVPSSDGVHNIVTVKHNGL